MAGLSLKCGALLKSVEEAQEHAELTSHSNFSESTEAVLNLVCTSCGKPCHSKTESDLLTKRIGHTEFSDEASTSAQGNNSVEGAFNWVVEHEDDPEINQMAMAPANTNAEPPKPSLTEEEKGTKLQELREQAHKKKEEEEELIEAKRIEHENEIKHMIALRKAEEEERSAIEKNLQQLAHAEDKKPSCSDSSLPDGYPRFHHEGSFKVLAGKATKPSIANGTNGQSDHKFRNTSSKKPICNDSSLADGYTHLHLEGSFKVQGGKDTKPSIATVANDQSDHQLRNYSSKGCYCFPWCGN